MLENQQMNHSSLNDNPDAEDRSFIFLLYPDGSSSYDTNPQVESQENDEQPIRVPFRTIVVGLLANQIILQTMGMMLVEGSPHIIPRYIT